MIELISKQKIDSQEYQQIRLELLDIWNKIFLNKNELDKAIFYNNKFWQLIKTFSTYFPRLPFAPKYNGVPLNSEMVLYSNQLCSVRNWEYAWAIANSDINRWDMKILDVGAGHSLFPLYLAGKSFNVTCVDNYKQDVNLIAPTISRIVKRRVDYQFGDIMGLPFKNDTFDYVYCISVLEHLEEKVINGVHVSNHKEQLYIYAVHELLRVVKPRGRVILTLQYGNDKSDKRSFTREHIFKLCRKYFDNLLVKPTDYEFEQLTRFDEVKEKEMSKLIYNTFPYASTKEPTGSIGIILTK